MSEAIRALRQVVHGADRLGRVVDVLSTPWLLLGCRLLLGQIVLVRQVMAMMTGAVHAWPGAAAGHALASTSTAHGLDSALLVVAPHFSWLAC
jgi:ABC-type antimicrobial peptide transport system permease subunit